ncbi:MAG: T9SS type A sorting domain-containing protein [Candidatus Cloacimonas sp.]|jgi:hypothetical protein|nr:T9SS type A sorting domain-containing protein [Candidatus Cloacimonas sp.]
MKHTITIAVLATMILISALVHAEIRSLWYPSSIECHQSSGPDYYSNDTKHYTFCYDAFQAGLLDSLSIYQSTVGMNGEVTITYFLPYTGEYSVVQSGANYISTSSWVDASRFYLGKPFYRISTRDLNSKLLEDKLVSSEGVTWLDYTYEYGSNGKVSQLNRYCNYCSPYSNDLNGFWECVMEYDSLDRNISEVRHFSADNVEWNPIYRLTYSYQVMDYIPLNFKIDEIASVIFEFDFFPFEVFSTYKVATVSLYRYENDDWIFGYDMYCPTYIIDSDGSLQVQQGVSLPNPTVKRVFNTSGQLVKHAESFFYPDAIISSATTYNWSFDGVEVDDGIALPPSIELIAYPNPFRNEVSIEVKNRVSSQKEISVYNLKGQLIRKLSVTPENKSMWDGKDLHGVAAAAGIYFLRTDGIERNKLTKIIKLP